MLAQMLVKAVLEATMAVSPPRGPLLLCLDLTVIQPQITAREDTIANRKEVDTTGIALMATRTIKATLSTRMLNTHIKTITVHNLPELVQGCAT